MTLSWDEISEKALSRPITEELQESMESSASIAVVDPNGLSTKDIHTLAFRIIIQMLKSLIL